MSDCINFKIFLTHRHRELVNISFLEQKIWIYEQCIVDEEIHLQIERTKSANIDAE